VSSGALGVPVRSSVTSLLHEPRLGRLRTYQCGATPAKSHSVTCMHHTCAEVTIRPDEGTDDGDLYLSATAKAGYMPS
jgi:hypothetical protein